MSSSEMLTVRCVSLRRPELYASDVLSYTEPGDILYTAMSEFESIQRKKCGGVGCGGLSPALLLPSPITSASNVPTRAQHIGELFTGYVTLHNPTASSINNVCVKGVIGRAELQRFDLVLNAMNVPVPPHSTTHFIVKHTLKDIGNHNCTATVDYTDEIGVPRSIRKILSFPVTKAVEVYDFQVHYLQGITGFLKFYMRGLAQYPIVLESVKVIPSDTIEIAKTLESALPNSLYSERKGSTRFIHLGEVRQFVFPFSLKDPTQSPHIDVGSVRFEWRNSYGEEGLLLSSRITSKGSRSIHELVLQPHPKHPIYVAEPFPLTFCYQNSGDNAVKPRIRVMPEKFHPLVVCGQHMLELGVVPPHSERTFALTAVSTTVGMLHVSIGLEITDVQQTHQPLIWPTNLGHTFTLEVLGGNDASHVSKNLT